MLISGATSQACASIMIHFHINAILILYPLFLLFDVTLVLLIKSLLQ